MILTPQGVFNDFEGNMKKTLLIRWVIKALIISLRIAPNIAYAGDSDEGGTYIVESGSKYDLLGVSLLAYSSTGTYPDQPGNKFDGFKAKIDGITKVKGQLFDITDRQIFFQTFRPVSIETDSLTWARKIASAGMGRSIVPPDSSGSSESR